MFQRTSMKSAVLAIAFAMSLAAHAAADELRTVNVPPGDLGKALRALADQVGVEFVYQSDQVRGLQSGGVSGDYSVREAVLKLLHGTELEVRADKATGALLITDPGISAGTESLPGQSDDSGTQPSSTEAGRSRGLIPEILVTGTRISGLENKTAPAVVLGRDAIDKSGYSTTQELIRSLPQNFSGGQSGASDDGIFGIASSGGLNFTSGSGINLRGLGNSSTLVLLNGHRMAPSAYGTFVDISLIPLAAVDRVEVLTHGTSALYGSDAVGGVVNIVTKSDYEGADTSIRYGAADGDTREEQQFAQTLGTNWGSGSIVATAQYMEQNALRSEDREFTEVLPSPTDILPETRMYAITANLEQSVTDQARIYANSLFSRRDSDRVFNNFDTLRTSDTSSKTWSSGVGFEYELTPAWFIRVGGEYSEQISDQVLDLPVSGVLNDLDFKDVATDVVLDGDVLQTDAGSVSLAAGVSYREQKFVQNSILEFGVPLNRRINRDIKAAFGELYVPLVSQTSNTPLINSLALSAAFRYDDYSDFGSTSNPRIGVYWSPNSSFAVRAAYSQSFRAPNASELLNIGTQILLVLPVADPEGGPDPIPGFVIVGSQDDIEAERARMVEVGFDFVPQSFPDLKFSVDYYRIRYKERIIMPPFDAGALTRPEVYGSLIAQLASDPDAQEFIDAAIADGWIYFDAVGTGATGVRNAIDFRQQNAALVEQSGFDIRATIKHSLRVGTLSANASIASINEIDTAFASDAESTDIVDTIGNPLRWRARMDIGWDTDIWQLSSAINFATDYVNNSVVGGERVDSWTTVDVRARLDLENAFDARVFEGLAVTLSALNIFNQDPPFVNAPDLIGVNYDPANANPLGRQLALEVGKRW